MNLTFVAIVAFCIAHCSSLPAPQNDLSEYFRVKHVIDDDHIRQQLLNSQIPDSQKRQILQDYVGISFVFQPDPPGAAEKKPWRAALGGKTGSTFILADPRKISSAVKTGIRDGVDSKGNPITKTQDTFPMIKIKYKFVTDGSGSGPEKNIVISFVNDGRPVIRYELLRVSRNSDGKIDHFESANKQNSAETRSIGVGASRRGSPRRG